MEIPNQLLRFIPPFARKLLQGNTRFLYNPKERKDKIAMREAAVNFINTEGYKLFVLDAIGEEINRMKYAYKVESMKESWSLAGKYEGLKYLETYLKRIIQEGDIAIEEQEREEAEKAKKQKEFDSNDLV